MAQIVNVESPYINEACTATIERNKSIRIVGKRSGRDFDITFELGATAEYDSYNLSYMGVIVGITDKTVSIAPTRGGQKKMLKLYEFMWRNYDFDESAKRAENSETMNYI